MPNPFNPKSTTEPKQVEIPEYDPPEGPLVDRCTRCDRELKILDPLPYLNRRVNCPGCGTGYRVFVRRLLKPGTWGLDWVPAWDREALQTPKTGHKHVPGDPACRCWDCRVERGEIDVGLHG